MRHFSKPLSESFVLCSERIVLECMCGERLILLGLEEDWRSQKSAFECACGAKLTLAHRIDKPPVNIRQLLNTSIRAPEQ